MLRAERILPERTIEFGSNEGIARAVAAGLGIAMLPAQVVRELTLIGELRPLNCELRLRSRVRCFCCNSKERPASPLVRAFCELLGRALEKH